MHLLAEPSRLLAESRPSASSTQGGFVSRRLCWLTFWTYVLDLLFGLTFWAYFLGLLFGLTFWTNVLDLLFGLTFGLTFWAYFLGLLFAYFVFFWAFLNFFAPARIRTPNPDILGSNHHHWTDHAQTSPPQNAGKLKYFTFFTAAERQWSASRQTQWLC